MNVFNFKVVLLGEGKIKKSSAHLLYIYIFTYLFYLFFTGCVGKTSLVLRYIHNKFNDQHLTTIQASFLKKTLNIENKRVNLAIWDTAGQERFHALGPIYYRDANGALLIYDITDRSSFDRVQNWVKELKKMLGDNITIVIAGNKIDLERQRVVSIEEGEKYARSVGATHFSTSAKLNKGVSELFLHISKEMLKRASAPAAAASSAPKADGSTLIIGESSEGSTKDGGGCC